MQLCRRLLPLIVSAFPLLASAQTGQSRLPHNLANEERTRLSGSASPRTRGAQDLGELDPGRPLRGITLVLRRSPEQQADLQQLLSAQQDPASTQFHHWLTPQQFAQRYGASDADLDNAGRWLTSQGFEVTSVANARDRITFSGSARQVEAAFGTALHRYTMAGKPHFAPASDLSLPAALASITTAVLHLSDVRPAPQIARTPRPAYTTASAQAHYLTPPDLSVLYDLPATSNDFGPGAGQSIAIVGQSYVDLSNASVVRRFLTSTVGLSLTPVLVPGTGVQAVSPGDSAESEVDLEYSAGLLNQVHALLVYVGNDPTHDVFDALTYAIDQDLAPVISVSYGVCESLLSPGELEAGNAVLEQAAAQGQTVVAASGDSGSTGCADFRVSGTFTAGEQQALAVSYPADSPYVTAVGGTQMAPGTFADGNTVYWRSSTSGYDSTQTLLSYVPEVVWNEDSATGVFASGGGASAILPRPAWQLNFPGAAAGSTRLLPDVAFQASAANPGFLFCSDDPEISPLSPAGQCSYGFAGPSRYQTSGGTSFAAPTFAAMVTLLNQHAQSLGQGNLNPILYKLAASPNAGSIFHDITTGSNACTSTTSGCTSLGASGYLAGAGFDEATGLGSIDLLKLQAAWPSQPSPNLQATTTSVQPFNTSLQPGQSDLISIVVNSVYRPQPNTAPTGTLSVAVDGQVVAPNFAFNSTSSLFGSGSSSYNFVGPSTPGSHVIIVTYPGDSTHGPSSAATSIAVGNLEAIGSVSLAAQNLSVALNGSGSTTVTATPSEGYNGRLVWSLALAGTSSLSSCYSIQPLSVQGVSATTLIVATGSACPSSTSDARTGGSPMIMLSSATQSAGIALRSPRAIAADLLVLGLLTPAMYRRRRLAPPALLLLFLGIGTLTLSGCGSSASASGGSASSTGSNYTVTLTGRDSVNTAIYSSTTFTLTVH